jgi:hypothetical protein
LALMGDFYSDGRFSWEIERPAVRPYVEYNDLLVQVYPPVWESATSPPDPAELPWIR